MIRAISLFIEFNLLLPKLVKQRDVVHKFVKINYTEKPTSDKGVGFVSV